MLHQTLKVSIEQKQNNVSKSPNLYTIMTSLFSFRENDLTAQHKLWSDVLHREQV